jgi:TldD protein
MMTGEIEEFELGEAGALLSDLLARSAAAGLYLIARAERHRSLALVANNGKIEEVRSGAGAGIGMHVFTGEGHSAFGCVDCLSEPEARPVLERTLRAAGTVSSIGATPNLGFMTAAPLAARIPAAGRIPFQAISIPGVQRLVLDLNRAAAGFESGLSVRTSLSFEREEWRVVRSDGTDANWVTTRFIASHAFTSSPASESRPAGGSAVATVRAAVSSADFDALDDPAVSRRLELRARTAARRARELPGAPRFEANGAVPLLIDYALAKGLAHEAFGHAAEADSFRSSVLAKDGRFRRGERVGRDGVSVIDEPIRGDHADQPISSNGERRRRVEIVKSGVLSDALTDLFSARAAGLESNGCERAESYASVPIPRMSNIRIEIAQAPPLPFPLEEMTPDRVRDLLGDAGILGRYPKVVYLSGYTGGQVNPVQGDFIFNCQALYELTPARIALHQPSSFRGSILAALQSLAGGFGSLQLDAIGTCGKWGQSVPSCGGSHGFVFLEPNESVGIGT